MIGFLMSWESYWTGVALVGMGLIVLGLALVLSVRS